LETMPTSPSGEQERKDRDELGRFAKGNKVDSPRRGRPSRADSMPILIAITQEYSIDELRHMLRQTYDMAVAKEDWKGMFQVLQFVMNYAVGKPVQRTLSATIDPEQIKRLFQGGGRDDDEMDDSDIVDVVAE
jgi:hypothetical protein